MSYLSMNLFFVVTFTLPMSSFCYLLHTRLLLHPSQVICKEKKVKKHYACQNKCSGEKGPSHGKDE